MAQTKVKLISDGVIDVDHLASGHGITTDNIGEGSNLYYTDARVSTYLSTNSYATEGYVTTAVSDLVAAAPSTLDTLNELAAALGDDPNFATTVTNSIATKLPLAGGTLTGALIINANTTNNQFILERIGTATGKYKLYTNNNSLWIYDEAQTSHRMMINSIGQVGIGNTSPSAKLHIGDGTTNDFIRIESSNGGAVAGRVGTTNEWFVGAVKQGLGSGSGLLLYTYSGGDRPIRFYPGGSEKVRFTQNGNVGIGTDSPTKTLDVNGAIRTRSSFNLSDGTTQIGGLFPYKVITGSGTDNSTALFAETGLGLRFMTNGSISSKMVIESDGNVGINTTSPTHKLDVAGNAKFDGDGNYTLLLNRQNGKPTIKGVANSAVHLIIDSASGSDAVFLQNYNSGNVYMVTGGGKVGIGATSPTYKLDVRNSGNLFYGQTDLNDGTSVFRLRGNGGSSELIEIKADGQVGIGTASPSEKLHIQGNVRIAPTGSALLFDTTGANASNGIKTINDYETVLFNGRGAAGFAVIGNSSIRLGFGTSYTAVQSSIYLPSSGNVGIGDSNPGNKLEVNGTTRTHNIVLSNSSNSSNTMVETYRDQHRRTFVSDISFTFTGQGWYYFNLAFPQSGGYGYDLKLVTGRSGNWRNFGYIKHQGYLYWEPDGDFQHVADGGFDIASSYGGGITANVNSYYGANNITDTSAGSLNYSYYIVRYGVYFPDNTTGTNGYLKVHLNTYGYNGTSVYFLKA
jgi:hypothetical protein